MKKILSRHCFAAGLCAALLAFSGCTSIVPVSAGAGTIGSRRGEASGVWLFGLPLAADLSAATAAANGGIKRIATIDVKTTNILGLVIVKTTIVTGDNGGAIAAASDTAGDGEGGAFRDYGEADEGEVVKVEGASGEAILDVSQIARAQNADSDIVLINGTFTDKFSVKVELLSKQTHEWVERGTAKFSDVNQSKEIAFGLGYTGKLSGVEQVRLTFDSGNSYTAAARVIEDNLVISLLPVGTPAIDFEIDSEILGKRASGSVKLKNKSSSLNWKWFSVYAKAQKDSDWEALGIVKLGDYVNGQPSTKSLSTFANIADYRYFGIVSLNKDAIDCEAKMQGKDLVFSISAKK